MIPTRMSRPPNMSELLIRRAGAFTALLLVAGCGSEASAPNQTGAAAAPVPAETPAPRPTPSASAAAVTAPAPAIVLEGDGLRLIDPETTHATPLPFGTERALVIRAIGLGMGGVPDETGRLEDCGPGPLDTATWKKGLQLYFQAGKFVGWGGAVDLKTMNGIGFGSTRKELEDAFETSVEQTSLGTEFSAAGMSGVLDSDKPTAQVQEIWAGMTCVAR